MSLSHKTTNDSEDEMVSPESPTIDEGGSSGGGGGAVLKKGPWTSSEDAILVEYVKKHGEGNWNAVQKYSGLSRCGKSCRLRWANHLRPNLKKGAFTTEEEHLIIELHAKMGNKWARMAAHLPGRTDNEIKNYWNTRIKRRQRAGLPLYPPELCVQAYQDNQQDQDGEGFSSGDGGHSDLLQSNNYDIPDVMFGNLSTNHTFLPYIPPLPAFSSGCSLMKGLGSPQLYSFIPPTRPCRKRFREPDQPLSGYGLGIGDEDPQFDRDQDPDYRSKGSPSPNMCFSFEPDSMTKKSFPFGAQEGRHSLTTGNYSASKPPTGAMKFELPSLQYPDTTSGDWASNPSLPALESVDSFILSPPPVPTHSDCPSPRNSGLLEALVYEAKALTGSKNPSSEKSSNSSTLTPEDMTESSPLNMGSAVYENYNKPNSHFRNSSASIFSDCTAISATRCSLEETPSAEMFSGNNLKSESIDQTWNLDREKKESSTELNYLRPDAILGSCWLGQSASCAKGQGTMTDAITELLGDDLTNDFKNTASGTSTPGFGSCSWNSISGLSNV